MARNDESSLIPPNWLTVEDIIRQGKHPTREALAVELRHTGDLSREVREYIARLLEGKRGRGRPTKTSQELENQLINNRKFNAALEVDDRWACVLVCREIEGGLSIAEAINKVAADVDIVDTLHETLFDNPKGLPKSGPEELTSAFIEHRRRHGTDYAAAAGKTIDDVIREVAADYGMTFEEPRDFRDVRRHERRSK